MRRLEGGFSCSPQVEYVNVTAEQEVLKSTKLEYFVGIEVGGRTCSLKECPSSRPLLLSRSPEQEHTPLSEVTQDSARKPECGEPKAQMLHGAGEPDHGGAENNSVWNKRLSCNKIIGHARYLTSRRKLDLKSSTQIDRRSVSGRINTLGPRIRGLRVMALANYSHLQQQFSENALMDLVIELEAIRNCPRNFAC